MSARIFLNYRRTDSEGYAGWLRKDLAGRFGTDHVFMDVVGIEPGEDFVEEINRQVEACDVFLAMIGPDWLGPRLEKANDFVRLEVEAALARGIRVIPLLVGGAVMPEPEQLPPSLAPLARRNAFTLTSAGWEDQVRRLCDVIERVGVAAASSTPPRTVEDTYRAVAKPVRPTGRATAPAAGRPEPTAADQIDSGPVDRLAFLPEGRRLATAGAGIVRVWPVVPSGPTFTTVYPATQVYGLTTSRDGRLLATGHNDGTALVWNARTGDLVLSVKRAKRVYDVAFSPDGSLLATAHDDRTARIWEVGSGMEHAPLRHDNVVYAVAFAADDPSLLCTATGAAGRAPLGGAARVWRHETGEVVGEHGYGDVDAFFTGAGFSPDGRRLAVTTSAYTALIFADGVAAEEISGVRYGQTVAFGSDGALAVAWSAGGASAYGPDGAETRIGGEEPLHAVALAPAGGLAATAGEAGPIRLWPLP